MSSYNKLLLVMVSYAFSHLSSAQNIFKGRVIDAATKEAVPGATVRVAESRFTCITNAWGSFSFTAQQDTVSVTISFVGYQPHQSRLTVNKQPIILLPVVSSPMQEVVVSASRQAVKRSEAPVAITSISTKMLQDAKPVSIDQVLNKVSGVYMVNLGNEQHQMSIRQPMTTKSLFLYLEDGIPVRTTGLFNHNALLEINMAAVKNIEVIKGPSSGLYGSEAIGGAVNFITTAPTAVPVLKLSTQANTPDYKRADWQSSFTQGKWGFALSGYAAQKKHSFIEYSDYHKATVTARADYHFSTQTSLVNTLTWLDYYSDMPGGIDSLMFAGRSFKNPQTFTYRKVDALRYRSTLLHNWNENSKTTASLIYRQNTIAQNPSYSIRNDFHKLSNGNWTGDKTVAHGEINESSFHSYAFTAQHQQKLNWKNAVVMSGISMDISPSGYDAAYIRVKTDTLSGKYVSYQTTDSMLTQYRTGINNYAAFVHFEFSPLNRLRVVSSLRYDLFHYGFNNYLSPSSYSGSPDTANNFKAVSPKAGFTYNFSGKAGLYANYSQGFVPPQVTEMYRGVKVPGIHPSVFYNYEMGGWMEIVKDKLSAEVSIYMLKGTNEIISVRLDDGTTENRNAGKTAHRGIELGMNASPVKEVGFRFSGAYSRHRFIEFVEKGIQYNQNEMNGAPHWMHNAEVWYKPSFAAGLRLGLEWQCMGRYFMDPQNTARYAGYQVFHARAGYRWKGMEVWVNAMNVTNAYYAFIAVKSSSGYSYTPSEPRHFTVGVSYDFGSLVKQ
jgi:outer membrane receptor protein involved in Fe transport